MSELLCCSLCTKTFTKANSLSRHKKRSHPEKPPKKFACFYCDYQSVYKCNLNKHMNNIHLNEDGALIEKRKGSCSKPLKVCNLCNAFECADRTKMIDHYVDCHDVPINEQILNFNSFDEFLSWKRDIESREYCRFVAASSKKQRLRKHVWFFRCFRDGHYMPRGTGRRSLKVKGSVKIGSVCPCSMKVTKTLETGTVSVLYITPHVGHKLDVSRLTLSKEEREYIANKISAGVPDDELLTSLRDSMSFVELSRLHLTTRKDLWNIKNAARIQKKPEADERRNCVEMKGQLINNIGKTSEVGKRSKRSDPVLTKNSRKNSGANERPEYAERKLAFIENIQKKPEDVGPKNAASKQVLINNIQKKPKTSERLELGGRELAEDRELDDCTKYEEMKLALLNNISSLIGNTTNCAQLEVIRKAFLPLPEAIEALESGLPASTNHTRNLESTAKIAQTNLKYYEQNVESTNYTNQSMNTVDQEHLVSYVLSEDVVQTIYAQDGAELRANELQDLYN